jgi:ABC-2 type transport system permease protein
MNLRRVGAMTAKEVKDIIRDPITVAIALFMPLVMLFLFGYAISLDVENVPLGVLDEDQSPASRGLVDKFVQSGYFHLSRIYTSGREVEATLQRSDVDLVLVIPHFFRQRLARHQPAPVQVLVDGTYSATGNLVAAYAGTIVSEFGHDFPHQTVRAEVRIWYNPSLRSVTYVVPGLFGVILMAFPPLLTALAIAREKETGTIQQIFASPLTASEFLLGKLIPYGAIAFIEIVTVVVIGFLWFAVPLRGNLELLLAAGLVYVFCTVGIGLLVSTITSSQLLAMLLAIIVTLMPSFLFSGFLFPIFTMPYILQLYTRIFPVRYFVDLSRGIVLKGASIPELWLTVVLLLAYTAAIFALAVWRFRKKVA